MTALGRTVAYGYPEDADYPEDALNDNGVGEVPANDNGTGGSGVRVEVSGKKATVYVDGAKEGDEGTVDWGDGDSDPWGPQGDDETQSPVVTHGYKDPGSYAVTVHPSNASQTIEIGDSSPDELVMDEPKTAPPPKGRTKS